MSRRPVHFMTPSSTRNLVPAALRNFADTSGLDSGFSHSQKKNETSIQPLKKVPCPSLALTPFVR
tara:strand:- start:13972 stop:14166 length:195 start_codon:yes stop_codon:yes gene_type:complete